MSKDGKKDVVEVYKDIFTKRGHKILSVYNAEADRNEDKYNPEQLIEELSKVMKSYSVVDVVCAITFILAESISASFNFDEFNKIPEVKDTETKNYIH